VGVKIGDVALVQYLDTPSRSCSGDLTDDEYYNSLPTHDEASASPANQRTKEHPDLLALSENPRVAPLTLWDVQYYNAADLLPLHVV